MWLEVVDRKKLKLDTNESILLLLGHLITHLYHCHQVQKLHERKKTRRRGVRWREREGRSLKLAVGGGGELESNPKFVQVETRCVRKVEVHFLGMEKQYQRMEAVGWRWMEGGRSAVTTSWGSNHSSVPLVTGCAGKVGVDFLGMET